MTQKQTDPTILPSDHSCCTKQNEGKRILLLSCRISLIRPTGLNKRIYNGSAFVMHAIFTSPHKAHRVTILVSQGLVMLEAFGFLSL